MKFNEKNKKGKRELRSFFVKQQIFINKALQSCNVWLQKRTNKYSSKTKRICLSIFCFAFISESSTVIYKSFKQHGPTDLLITPIHAMPLLKTLSNHSSITNEEIKKIKAYKYYLDSLNAIYKTKPGSDIFLSNNKNLLDTINLLENLYYEQQANRH